MFAQLPTAQNKRLRYLANDRPGLGMERKLIESYQDELIHSFGLDFTYFRKEHDFIVPENAVAKYSDPIYGESASSPFNMSAPIIAHMQVNSDEFLMQQLGMSSSTSSYTVTIMVKRFQEAFRSQLGQEETSTFSIDISRELTEEEIEAGEIVIEETLSNENVSGKISATITLEDDGIPMEFESQFVQDSIAVNEAFVQPEYYTGIYNTSGSITGILSKTGNLVTGTLSGDITYNVIKSKNEFNPDFQIAPQVGDVMRLEGFTSGGTDNNLQEFKITRIRTSNLAEEDINQLMASNVIYKMDMVRRMPSHDDIADVDGTVFEELAEFEAQDATEYHTPMIESESNKIHDYEVEDIDDVDKKMSDDIYGGYSAPIE